MCSDTEFNIKREELLQNLRETTQQLNKLAEKRLKRKRRLKEELAANSTHINNKEYDHCELTGSQTDAG